LAQRGLSWPKAAFPSWQPPAPQNLPDLLARSVISVVFTRMVNSSSEWHTLHVCLLLCSQWEKVAGFTPFFTDVLLMRIFPYLSGGGKG